MVRKELRQIFRDFRMRALIFVAPIIQLVVFGYAVSTDVRQVPTFVVDYDRTTESRQLVDGITASGYFTVQGSSDHAEDLDRALALDTLRHKRASPIDDMGHLEALHVIDDSADVAGDVARRERISLMADAIAELPARCRDVFILHKIKGCSRRETAAQLGLAEKTVEVQTANAMRRCGNYLRRHGVTGISDS